METDRHSEIDERIAALAPAELDWLSHALTARAAAQRVRPHHGNGASAPDAAVGDAGHTAAASAPAGQAEGGVRSVPADALFPPPPGDAASLSPPRSPSPASGPVDAMSDAEVERELRRLLEARAASASPPGPPEAARPASAAPPAPAGTPALGDAGEDAAGRIAALAATLRRAAREQAASLSDAGVLAWLWWWTQAMEGRMSTPVDLERLTPAERRALLARLLGEGGEPQAAPRTAPASFAQERLWFLDRMQPGGAPYNLPVAMRITGAVDVPSLRRALAEVVRRHEVLRTTLSTQDGRPVQVIAPPGPVDLPVIDLRHLPRDQREAEAARLSAEDATWHFDLERGPLLRARLARIDEGDWALLVAMHHVVGDGWSMGIFFRELSTLWSAFANGLPSPLPEPPLQYADYARDQRRRLSGPALDALLAYWKEALAGAPTLLELPTDRPRPPVQSFRGGAHAFRVPPETAARVRALARRENATPFMALLASFAALLFRYTGQADLLVGSPIAGRTRSELEGLIGFFVNTLVLRADLSGDPPFRELLRRVRDTTLGAYAHQELPFERLVEELQPQRSLSHNPLFQVVFSFANVPTGLDGGGGSAAGGDGAQTMHGTAKFDLMLFMAEDGAGMAGGIEYNADLFDPPTIARMAGHLATLLGGVAADPELPVSALPLLTEEEWQRVLVEWNQTETHLPGVEGAHRLVEAQAARTPHAPAVWDDEGTLSYAGLNARANRLARRLRALGAAPERCVGVCLERTADLAVAALAAFKSGGAYLPLDPAYPPERLEWILRDAAAPVVVTRGALLREVGAPGAAVLRLDADAPAIAAEAGDDLPGGAGPENLAYVIYTSGSTGRPKGTMVEHRAFTNLVAWYAERAEMGPRTRSLLMIPIGFDASLKNVMAPLAVGGQAVLTRAELSDAAALLRVIATRGVTDINCTPSLANPVVAAAAPAGYAALASLRHLLLGGEAVTTPPLRPWLLRPECGCTLVNVYGPTECTDVSSSHAATRDEVAAFDAVPIGRPVHNARLYVLDAAGRPLPVGVPGELCIAGAGVARGYLNRPDLTRERFGPAPAVGEARVYRTGDRARWRADGTVEFLGRMDDQVKVRGVRVEPGEIETVLGEHPGVGEAVVAARPHPSGGARLVAWVVGAANGHSPRAADLRAFLRGRLPEYLVPSAFVFMDALPLSPNGKVDRRALPDPPPGGDDDAGAPYAAPATALEAVLADIWRAVLGVPRVGTADNFFDLGGHSLLATQVASRVRDALGAEVPLHLLFAHPTVAGLAAALADAGPGRERLERAAEVARRLASMSEVEVQERLRALSAAGGAP
jgi:amino acid adenylation domain-containing protein